MAARIARDTQSVVDHLLDSVEQGWIDAVEIVQRWDTLDDIEQTDFVVEWPLTLDCLSQLLRYADRGQLTPPQRKRLKDVQAYIRDHDDLVAAVLGQHDAVHGLPRS
jgi:hypothetical protein